MDVAVTSERRSRDELAPYHVFDEVEWARLRADQPMTLSLVEIQALQGFNDYVDPDQVETIYLPLSRLLTFYLEATQGLHSATSAFLGRNGGRVPFIIGIAGSVAVGKTTTARLLQALLARWPSSPKVDLVTTDGFLYPNATLLAEGLMEKKGFPESYDVGALINFLADIKAGVRHVQAPVYSHLTYDRVPGETIEVDQPDILIVEGLNVLQTSRLSSERQRVPFVSDFFDFSIYIDADEDALERWYMTRFMRLKETRFTDPRSYFHQYAGISDGEATHFARRLWRRINLKNLRENVGPTKLRADLILHKDEDHRIDQVALRKV
ncbi:type I pantothenate kinase [Acuticoccus mangrovi]|uniref:Pantothenate kinase n=1 Tax=Acuticoccus mangrovi TaxID=2796142 RepID=A0A934MHJ2_9HYPH|nr:type I pantothenate kinase [Acuticoccus mangrovi]MBJ3777718.1 type I pantothenate kinase [Acuticoccus mangrovi]